MKQKDRILSLLLVWLIAAVASYGNLELGASASNPIQSGTPYTVLAQAQGYNWGETAEVNLYKNGTYLGGDWSDYGAPTPAIVEVTSVEYGNKTVVYYADAYIYSDESDTLYYNASINVNIVVPAQSPLGSFDQVTSSAYRGQAVSASGWAADYEMGAPVSRVDYYIDNSLVGQANLGGSRPDVQSAKSTWGDLWQTCPHNLTNSGWGLSYGTGGLSAASHTMRIVAYDNQGLSTDLGTKNFVVQLNSQTITFSNPGTQTCGTPLTLGASASSGLPVSYAISGPAYLSGNTLHFTAAGAVTVIASQSGNAEYSAASSVTQTFAVNPLSQSITFNNPGTQTYGGSVTLNASASSGLSVSYGVSGPANLSGNIVYFTGTGTVTITASQAGNAFYSAAANVVQAFAVSPQPTSFSISNASFTYDGQSHSPAITANPSGANYILGGTTSGTAAGSYTITATATGNYSGSASFNWSIGQQGQSITFPNPGSQTYGTPLTLNASASSELPVSYSVSGPATLSGNVLTFTGIGSVSVTASQSGNQNYSAAADVSVSFTINPKPATFSLSPTSFTYNGSAQGPSVSASPSDATYTVSGPISSTNYGTYTVTITASGNYTGSNTLSWHIAATGQTITFNQPVDQTYGDTLILNATASSGMPISYSVGSGPATVSGNVVSFTGCGAVSITASQAGNSNYSSAANVNRTFTVNPRPASFALSGASFTYNGGTQGPSVAATPSDATYTISSGSLTGTGGGTYPVTITATGNYTGGASTSWTINKASQSITFTNPGTQNAGASLTLNAMASSGLPVSYTGSGPLSLNGNVATFTVGGTATIIASQPGNPNYNGASEVVVSFAVIDDPNGDNDHDGMPNGWETAHGLSPNDPSDAFADPDGDGLTNVAEYNLEKNLQVPDPGRGGLGNTLPAGWGQLTADGLPGQIVAGVAAGNLTVGQDGMAGYTIPIWTVPGTAGMAPKISLSYSSGGGNGVAGYGWSISGISSIARGPKTLSHDGFRRGIEFDREDAYYLDGKRLVHIPHLAGAGHSYAGAEYRTDEESFSRVVAQGQSGAGPASFKVYTKEGLIIEYGVTINSRLRANGPVVDNNTVKTWMVSKISDYFGNFMVFEYENNPSTGEQTIVAINYTGKEGAGAHQPYASLAFEYEARNDTSFRYVAGAKYSSSKRLKTVKSLHGASVVRSYTLDHVERDPVTRRSILTQITETGKNGESYKPTTFEYTNPEPGWTTLPLPSGTRVDFLNTPLVDINGDGRLDIQGGSWVNIFGAKLNLPSGWKLADGSNGTPNYTPPLRTPLTAGPQIAADINGDGLMDYLNADGAAYLNSGNGFVPSTEWSIPAHPMNFSWLQGSPNNQQVGGYYRLSFRFYDVNGDGFDDCVINGVLELTQEDIERGTVREDMPFKEYWIRRPFSPNAGLGAAWMSATDSYGHSPWEPFGLSEMDGVFMDFMDLNGDGRLDKFTSGQEFYWYGSGPAPGSAPPFGSVALLNNGNGYDIANGGLLPAPLKISDRQYYKLRPTELVDVNGDGMPDAVRKNSGVYTSYNYLFGMPGWSNVDIGGSETYFNTGNSWERADSGFESPIELVHSGTTLARGVVFIDVNEDGLQDLVYAVNNERQTYLGTPSGWVQDPRYNLSYPFKYRLPTSSQSDVYGDSGDFSDIDGDGSVDQLGTTSNDHYVAPNNQVPGGGFVLFTNNSYQSIALNKRKNPDKLSLITDSLGVKTAIEYSPLSERDTNDNFTVYQKDFTPADPQDSDPLKNVIPSIHVVKTITREDGVGGHHATKYKYGAMRSSRVYGNLGFEWMSVTDSRTDITTTTVYSQQFPYIGRIVETFVKTNGGSGVTLGESSITYKARDYGTPAYRFIYPEQVLTKRYGLDGTLISYEKTTTDRGSGSDYDAYGNSLYSEVDSGDGYIQTSVNTYSNIVDTSRWLPGLLTSRVTITESPSTDITHKTTYDYDSNTGRRTRESVEPLRNADPNNVALVTDYLYDDFGNVAAVASYAPGNLSEQRTATTIYDSMGRFPISKTNGLNHTEYYSYYADLGALETASDANGNTSTVEYDGFGRQIRQDLPDGTSTVVSYRWPSGNAPAGSAYLVVTETTGAPPAVAFFDKYTRSTYAFTLNGGGLDGLARIVGTGTEYDQNGRAYRKYLPFYYGDSPSIASEVMAYDLLDRPLTIRTADEDMVGGWVYTTNTYSGRTATSTNPLGRIEFIESDLQGRVLRRVNNASEPEGSSDRGEVHYEYDPSGNLLASKVRRENGSFVATTLIYDHRGRKIGMSDPDSGEWQYCYNHFGELIWQRNALGQETSITYDQLGRLKTRIDANGQTTWTYDSASGAGIGKLHTVTAPGGYTETVIYDGLGRVSTASRLVEGVSYPTNFTYDYAGRLEKTIYPSTFAVKNIYNAFGFLKEIRQAGGPTPLFAAVPNQVFWQADSYAVTGQVDGATLGNGLTYDRVISPVTGRVKSISSGLQTGANVQHLQFALDALGQISRRLDLSTGRDERYVYDGLNRLTSHAVEGGPTVTLTYDAIGNILTKSDVGTYIYGQNGAGPHALTSISGGPLGYQQFDYDAAGRMTSGAGQTYAWSASGDIISMGKAGLSTQFQLGAARERVVQTRSDGGKTVYIGAIFERSTEPSGLVEERNYVMTPLGRTAVYTLRNDGTAETRYLHQDGFGTVAAITDEFGRVEKRFVYDAWGKQVKTVETRARSGGNITRGYTDHEMLADFGLIHMNGRVFNPITARFLSCDPVVQDLGDSQTYNRYSYCANNPINFSDPTGNFMEWFSNVIDAIKDFFSGGSKKDDEEKEPPAQGTSESTEPTGSQLSGSVINENSNPNANPSPERGVGGQKKQEGQIAREIRERGLVPGTKVKVDILVNGVPVKTVVGTVRDPNSNQHLYDQSSNSREHSGVHSLTFWAKNPNAAADQVFSALSNFRFFNNGTVARVSLNAEGTIARFTPNSWFKEKGLEKSGFDTASPVRLAIDSDNRVVHATTLEGHFLVGNRSWGVVTSPDSDLVTVFTYAKEKILFPASAAPGMQSQFAKDQDKVWRDYLTDTVNGVGYGLQTDVNGVQR